MQTPFHEAASGIRKILFNSPKGVLSSCFIPLEWKAKYVMEASKSMANLFEAPRFIAIEGPIRVGKSTLAAALAEKLLARRIAEPEDNPFLDRFYRGEPGMAFQAQMWFLHGRHEQMQQLARTRLRGQSASWAKKRAGRMEGIEGWEPFRPNRPEPDCSNPHPPVPGTIVADYLFEKDKIFANLNLSDSELALYNRYYRPLRAEAPVPDLVIYLKASPEVLKQRLRRKGVAQERVLSDAYIEQISKAYEHFFYHYTASDLLVVDTSEIDFVHQNRDLQMLLKRLSEPVKGTQYFLPLRVAS